MEKEYNKKYTEDSVAKLCFKVAVISLFVYILARKFEPSFIGNNNSVIVYLSVRIIAFTLLLLCGVFSFVIFLNIKMKDSDIMRKLSIVRMLFLIFCTVLIIFSMVGNYASTIYGMHKKFNSIQGYFYDVKMVGRLIAQSDDVSKITGPMSISQTKKEYRVSNTNRMKVYTYYLEVYSSNSISYFVISRKDVAKINDMISQNDSGKFEVTYNDSTGFVEKIEFVEESKTIQSADITLTPDLDENGSLNKDTTYFIERPEIEGYEGLDGGLYWYVTKDGEFFESNNASLKKKVNFPSFYNRGDYEVTLVVDYDQETGEHTPISNTLSFSVK